MKCAAYTTGPVGSKTHQDSCKLHGGWTFDCLLAMKKAKARRRKKAAPIIQPEDPDVM